MNKVWFLETEVEKKEMMTGSHTWYWKVVAYSNSGLKQLIASGGEADLQQTEEDIHRIAITRIGKSPA